MFDEVGGNWDAIEKVFGHEAIGQCVLQISFLSVLQQASTDDLE